VDHVLLRPATLPVNVSAAALALGGAVRLRDAPGQSLSRGVLRGRSWEQISYGLHAPANPARTMEERARLMAQLLPRDSGFGHLTSAALRGWWLPLGLHMPGLMFASTTAGVHIQRHGLYVRRSAFTTFEDVDGLRLVSAEETLLELARDLTLVDLVPMVDCALAAGASPISILAAARRRAKGAARLRRAVMLSDRRSESWWESVLRLVHEIAGLGPVQAQVELFNDGVFVARADLHLVGTNRYPECDGGEHRTRERHEHDLTREKAMARLGADRFGYSTAEIARSPEMIIRDAEDARGLSHDPGRALVWWKLARRSTLTPHGRTLLAARIARYRAAANR
jgi:hypothetical protein